MRLHHAAGRRRDAEIAIGGIGPQALVEVLLAQMADVKAASAMCFGSAADFRDGFAFSACFRLLGLAWSFALRFTFAIEGLPRK